MGGNSLVVETIFNCTTEKGLQLSIVLLRNQMHVDYL